MFAAAQGLEIVRRQRHVTAGHGVVAAVELLSVHKYARDAARLQIGGKGVAAGVGGAGAAGASGQVGIRRLCIGQCLEHIRRHQFLLGIGQVVVSLSRRIDRCLASPGHGADGTDLGNNIVHYRLILLPLQRLIQSLAHGIGAILQHLHQLIGGLFHTDDRFITASVQAAGQIVVSATVGLFLCIGGDSDTASLLGGGNAAHIDAVRKHAAEHLVITDHCSNTACITGLRVRGGDGSGVSGADDSAQP